MDWGIGRYEQAAEQLLPVARVVVERAAPGEDEHVLDLGCGTGNAALLAAERGGRVTGVDPAPRLLEVARGLAAERGVEASFARGEAAAIPLADGEADVVLSVFGVIFAPDAEAAAAEMARVTAPRGRIVLSAWIPGGTIGKLAAASREAVAQASGGSGGSRPFSWHDRAALAGLLGPHGFQVESSEERIAFTAESPEDYLHNESDQHPLWIAARSLLEPRGDLEPLRERALEILEAGNEDPDAFRATSRYVVATARRA
ncbi:MAG TPA: methyltransferase domain-containing protein [Thermoleophilaceae bacterium]|jgi:SAM-dependent methyltransferase